MGVYVLIFIETYLKSRLVSMLMSGGYHNYYSRKNFNSWLMPSFITYLLKEIFDSKETIYKININKN